MNHYGNRPAALPWINAEALANSRLQLDSKGKFNGPNGSEFTILLGDNGTMTDPLLQKVLTAEFK